MNKCWREYYKWIDKISNKYALEDCIDMMSYSSFSAGWKSAKADTKTKKVKKNAAK